MCVCVCVCVCMCVCVRMCVSVCIDVYMLAVYVFMYPISSLTMCVCCVLASSKIMGRKYVYYQCIPVCPNRLI